jgi:hypothetical protein
MKKFMAVYCGAPGAMAAWEKLSEAERNQKQAAGMKAWGDWMATHQKSIVDSGGPLGKTKRTNAQGVTDIRNSMGGYTVVQAESQEAAAKMFLNHPHFTIFPGDSVEVMEVLPIPGR